MLINVMGHWINPAQVTSVTRGGTVSFSSGTHSIAIEYTRGEEVAAILNAAEYDLDGHITQLIKNTQDAVKLAQRLTDENRLLKAELEGLRALNNAT